MLLQISQHNNITNYKIVCNPPLHCLAKVCVLMQTLISYLVYYSYSYIVASMLLAINCDLPRKNQPHSLHLHYGHSIRSFIKPQLQIIIYDKTCQQHYRSIYEIHRTDIKLTLYSLTSPNLKLLCPNIASIPSRQIISISHLATI